MNMQYSKHGMELTKQFESCKLTTYLDIKGIPTIGWGHTGPDVTIGLTITQARADELLLADCASAVATVNRCVHIAITQNEFDALVDFAFNVGNHALETSTLIKLLNAGDFHGAAEEFHKWDHASGKEVAGLLRRRLAERDEFNTP